ncbi:MAG: MoaD/ThiS family protein [Chloroflexi bacterium]|nr:MoaD/ThiS family protein [Chloroflexota bacterium]
MRVEVRLFATLRRYVPDLQVGEALTLEVPEGTTPRDLLAQLGIPPDDVKIIMRNGRHIGLDDPLADGDRIAFIPAVGGG